MSFRNEQEIVIACTPHEDAALVWGRVDMTMDATNKLPKQIDYLDEDMQITRTMTFGAIADMDGRTIPTTMEITVAEKPSERTLVTYDQISFDVPIDDRMFTIMALKRESRK